jgi:branched-chain amino acid transport system substrate-binding protein
MSITRRNVLLGTVAAAAFAPIASRAQASEVVIGILYPFSGASAQQGVDAQKAYEAALEVINNKYDFDLPLAKDAGLTGLGGAKIRLVYADHQGDPQKGRAEAERLITQEKVSAIVGTYQSAVAVTVSQTCERYQIPFVSADNSSPSLHTRGLKFFFRAAPHDEMFSKAMFDFYDAMRRRAPRSRRWRCSTRTRSSEPTPRTPRPSLPMSAATRSLPTSSTAPTRRHCRRRFSSSRSRMPTS